AINSTKVCENNEIEDESNSAVYESETNDHNTTTSSANALGNITIILGTITPETTTPEPETTVQFSRNLSEEDKYLLAKIAMAEAEGESIETKILVIMTILNRVYSNKSYFPDTIEQVILQNSKGVYQFTPVMPGGRWWRLEPNAECWEAVEIVNATEEDVSNGALYFEACRGESWHSRNLELICQSDNTRFYK
ncbi:MAG: cell wall hydrolase, partial [Bacteroidales bacterium]|nr:cell wall hydrolase [Bacteroidales bacterium]